MVTIKVAYYYISAFCHLLLQQISIRLPTVKIQRKTFY